MATEIVEEVGTEAPCPKCQRPRVRRSTYLRCNPCGLNWIDDIDFDLNKDPRIERFNKLVAKLRLEAQLVTKKEKEKKKW